jgi:galactose mutarotase-like enzyme
MLFGQVLRATGEDPLSDDIREQFQYRSNFHQDDPNYKDVFSGSMYKNTYLGKRFISGNDSVSISVWNDILHYLVAIACKRYTFKPNGSLVSSKQ